VPNLNYVDPGHAVMGSVYTLEVPFTGDREYFTFQPGDNDLHPPRAIVGKDSVTVHVAAANVSADQVNSRFDAALAQIEKYLAFCSSTLRDFPARFHAAAHTSIRKRLAKLQQDSAVIAGLKYPLKVRADAPQTHEAPAVRKSIVPLAVRPEPILEEEHYSLILNVMQSMAHVMERSPSAFATMREEDLRQHFLVQLNGRFVGAASGETFNYGGKTDILVRVQDRNIFIAEFKFWTGPKSLTQAIDQLLDYLSWRDTKAAIVVFNRNRDFTAVLKSIEQAAGSHPHKKRGPVKEAESRFRCVFGNPSDPEREIVVTILAFDIPQPS
jgi:hypothetical protein